MLRLFRPLSFLIFLAANAAQAIPCESLFSTPAHSARIELFRPRYETDEQRLNFPDSKEGKKQKLLRDIFKLSGADMQVALTQYAKSPADSRIYQVVQRGALAFNYAVISLIGVQAAQAFIENPWSMLTAAIAAPLGFFAADFTTAVYHKWMDGLANTESTMAQTFRKHHENPKSLDGYSYREWVGTAAVQLAPVFFGAAFFDMPLETKVFCNVYLLAGLNTMALHGWAHMKDPPKLVKKLQDIGLIISKDQHKDHHARPYDDNFAMVNGISEKLLFGPTGFWLKFDVWWWKATGKMPYNWIQDFNSIPDAVVSEILAHPERVPTTLWASVSTYAKRVGKDAAEINRIGKIREAVRLSKDLFLAKRRAFYHRQVDQIEAENAWNAEVANFGYLLEGHDLAYR